VFGFLKCRAEREDAEQRRADAYELGANTGSTLAVAIDAYLDPRFVLLRANLLIVSRQRLEAISDQPGFCLCRGNRVIVGFTSIEQW
jgi:hypothetical protein